MNTILAWLSGSGFLGAILLALANVLKQSGKQEAKLEMQRDAAEVERDMQKVVMKDRTTAQDIKRMDDGTF